MMFFQNFEKFTKLNGNCENFVNFADDFGKIIQIFERTAKFSECCKVFPKVVNISYAY